MTNLLQDGATWLAGQLQSHASRTVAYERAGTPLTTLSGVCEMREYQVLDSEGMLVNVAAFDWTFTASDLIVSGERIVARTGDTIVETLNSREVRYEAAPLGDMPCQEWCDSAEILVKVHTKRVS